MKLYSDKKVNRLNHGSIIPDLKYILGNKEPPKASAQSTPNFLSYILLPQIKITTKVTMPQTAFGKRAAKSVTPKILIAPLCIQINIIGFSQNGLKLI